MNKLVIAGGTGFLGNEIAIYFKLMLKEIVVLTRGKSCLKNQIKYVNWDGKNSGNWISELRNCDVLINMVGKSVDCRYTEKNKKLIISSRLDATKILGEVLSKMNNPPQVWINSSTATIYKHSLDKPMCEQRGIIGKGFSVSVAKKWEKQFYASKLPKTRKVALRTSIVLAKNGGAFPPIKRLAQFGFGGKQGKGNQIFSWIHIDDFLECLLYIIKNKNLNGAVNCVSPNSVTNKILMKSIRDKLGIPYGFPLPKIVLEIGAKLINTETELLLKSRYVTPNNLIANGFVFKYKNIDKALENLCAT